MAELDITTGNLENGTGDIRARIDAIHVRVVDAPVWNADGTQKRLRIRLTPPAGLESQTWSGYSHLFAPSFDGKHQWDGYIFPGPGEWDVRLHDEEEETDLASETVTVV